MGMRNLRSLLDEIVAGGTPLETPAAAVMNGTRAEQRVELATLETLADAVEAKGLGAPSVIVIGQVAALGETLSWWESSPLFGLGALVSRAPHQARELAAALRAAGAIPSFRPLIDLVAVEDPGERGVIDTSLGRLADYDDLLFTSSNAVRFFLHHVERLGLESSLPGLNARILCIGPSTARAVTAAGLPVHFMLSGGRGDADSMLSELLRSHPPTGRRVLIPRSDIARDVLSRGLAAAGAHVDAVTHYRNIRPEVDAAALGADLIGGALPLLPFTSPSAVEHFAELLDEAARDACQRCIISAIGTTTAAALESIGLPPQVVPERPDVRGMVEALENYVAKGREAGSLPSGWGEKKK
jgi:uroporphyrinogen III methyltransferase/synthase